MAFIRHRQPAIMGITPNQGNPNALKSNAASQWQDIVPEGPTILYDVTHEDNPVTYGGVQVFYTGPT